MSRPLYALRRGRDWIAAPTKRQRKAVPRHNGQATFLHGLTLSRDPAQAWVTDDLEVAHRRRELLRIVPPGWATSIVRVP